MKKSTLALSLLLAFSVLFTFIGCASTKTPSSSSRGGAPAAAPAAIDDPLNDYSRMFSHSPDMDFDIKNPSAWQNGDASRIWPSTGDPQNIVYKVKNVSSFAFVVGYYTWKHQDNPAMHGFKAYVSADGQAWTELESVSEASDNGCWLFTTWKPKATIPSGSNYVKFEFFDKDLHWSSEVSEIHVYGR